MAKTREAGGSGLALLAAELVAARKMASLSQDELASRITYSGSMVAMIEGLRRVPSLDFAERCDQVFETTGTFGRLQQLAPDYAAAHLVPAVRRNRGHRHSAPVVAAVVH
jgi:transcriptional regulator with XRE-family HTH domain